MVLFSEMFLSELVGVPVVDKLQEPLGSVRDIIFARGEIFPKATGLVVGLKDKKEEAVVLMEEIDSIGSQFVVTRSVKNRIVFARLFPQEFLLWKDVMDKQILDTGGARIIRVNDLKLARVDQDVRLMAADVGLRGLLRRLSLLAAVDLILGVFRRRVPDTLISWDHVESLKIGEEKGGITVPTKHLSELHPADIAQVISQVRSEEKTAIFDSLSEKTAAEALHELEPKIQAMLLLTVDTKKALGILEKMPLDEAADVLGDLPSEKTEEFLRLLRPRRANEIRKLLAHPEETAGGLMTTEFITIPQNLTTEQTIERLRELAPDVETIYYLYVVEPEPEGKLVGILSLRSLIIAPSQKPIAEIMIKDSISVSPKMNQREVADVISKYNLLALPVVDPAGRIIGIITVDDVIDFILPPISRRKRQMIG
jgi:CBS domain-containing protein/sporulation protein YlmC with PRC-barrel domain